MTKKIVLCILIVLWMGLIFTFSAQKATESNKVSTGVTKKIVRALDVGEKLSDKDIESIAQKLNFIVRKGTHFSAFAVLGILVALLLKQYDIAGVRRLIFSVGTAFLYACSDEFHQTFVRGRSGEVRDVMIDTFGALFGVLFMMMISYTLKKRKERKKTHSIE